jgi:hypothetical protein
MRKRFCRRPSPAMIVALVALCLAAGGTAIAAKVKLGKGAVKTKNIRKGAVTEPKLGAAAVTEPKLGAGAVTEAKLGAGAVSVGKLAGSAKASWLETNAAGSAIAHQSGGVTMTPNGMGSYVVDFGTDITNRAISITPVAVSGALITVQYGRCADTTCPAAFAGSASAIEIDTFDVSSAAPVTTGFTAMAVP